LSGGKFGNGAQTGAFQFLFNQVVHAGSNPRDWTNEQWTEWRRQDSLDFLYWAAWKPVELAASFGVGFGFGALIEWSVAWGINVGRGAPQLTRVGRWMSETEFTKMSVTGRVVEGTGGRTSVIRPSNPASFKPPPSSTIYAEFNVPSGVLRQGGRPDWAIIPGPNIQTRMFGPSPTSMPPATCIACTIRN